MNLSKFLPALLLGVTLSLPAFAEPAEPPAAPPGGERPCHADAMKYCGDHVGNRDAMRTCMQQNRANLSEQCQAAMQARMQGHMQGQMPGQMHGGQAPQSPSGATGSSDES